MARFDVDAVTPKNAFVVSHVLTSMYIGIRTRCSGANPEHACSARGGRRVEKICIFLRVRRTPVGGGSRICPVFRVVSKPTFSEVEKDDTGSRT